MDVSNGEGIGISLFVSGCNFHCKNCFNSEAWDFNYGKEFDENAKEKFLKLLDNPKIVRISILGGEPLCDENISEVSKLIFSIKATHPDLKIWVYTGYTAEVQNDIYGDPFICFSPKSSDYAYDRYRSVLAANVDVIVDGQYIDELRDMNLSFKGSANQRVIDIQQTISSGVITCKYD